MNITVDINGQPVLNYLNQLLAKSSHLQPLVDAIGQEVSIRKPAHFEARANRLEQAWAPRSPSTNTPPTEQGRGFLPERYRDMLHGPSRTADADSGTLRPEVAESILDIVREYLAQ